MKYVIDCSTAFPIYVAEPLTAKATAVRDDYLSAIHELLAPDEKERVGADDECTGLPLHEGCDSTVDFAFAAGFRDIERHSLRARRFLHISDH